MPQVSSRISLARLSLMLLAALVAASVGLFATANANDRAGASSGAVVADDTDCACEESGTCPTPTAAPSSPPSSPMPSASALALAALKVAAIRLVSVVDVDMTGFANGHEIGSLAPPGGNVPPEFKTLCPKNPVLWALYTTNPFQGDLLSIQYFIPPLDPRECMITIKVLDPATGRVLETYESPSNLIVVKDGAIGFKRAPARIRVEVRCDE